MNRTMLKSKIHRATVTDSDLHYVGSITIDAELLEAADILEHEQVHVLDIDNGARFETYAIEGGPGDVILNGAAARLILILDGVDELPAHDGQFSLAGLAGFQIQVGLSQLGPLDAMISVNLPEGIILDPDTGIAINNYLGRVIYGPTAFANTFGLPVTQTGTNAVDLFGELVAHFVRPRQRVLEA